ncbi:hypothetical protein EAS64_18155 [Trebonia kvetii]|uniref:Uncharacterized protein n=1 Tax=Trebonia kvetii TaxID=2480626 RepID=A0A6P2C1X1_9ACTN|nr:hypothetical protein [Trebonia kvetii]TVZ04301.1 hypothetical protein EAS64_18155 [Trebonia kvetii]
MFDNVHFFRDNPNVPSDLELMPNLLNFFKDNGTILSNNHTPLIAHTAADILSTYTGLYGDRNGVGISNSYRTYNTDGTGGTFKTTDPATAFTYWTAPIQDTLSTPNAAHDTNPNMVYSPVPPATASTPVAPNTVTPAPWVPYTRAGCDWGAVATANVELENTKIDMPTVFGANSPEVQQLNADPDSFKDQESADYVGVAVHCAQGAALCADATANRGNQTTPSLSAQPDLLPNEPGGYTGFQGLFGHKYVAPVLGAGTPNVTNDGYAVTNAAGNLVDLNGNQLNGAFLSTPGFPGFSSINASQTLAYMADMLESGVPVVNGYISDIHGNEHIPGVTACNGAPAALGSGSACYIAQAQYYNTAFGAFFQRLAAEGITPANTEFILNVDEGDHEAGANVGRAIQPTPANCDGATVSGSVVTQDVPCTYPAGSFGELAGNLTGLLATQKGNTTPFTVEADTAPEFYLTGNPGPNDLVTRQFEKDVAGLTAANPYTGTTQPIANFIADPMEEGILHMVDADPARTPTFALFAKPDYFLSTGAANCNIPCVAQTTGFAWDHGDYAAEINSDYAAFAGPGVKNLGIDGFTPAQGPSSAGANSGQTEVVDVHNPGTWTDTTDIRQTELYLTGLRDDYTGDGQVIAPILADPNHALRNPETQRLGACYKQLDSSVGQFGAATLVASTKAVESTSANDKTYTNVNTALFALEKARDALAGKIKAEFQAAAFQDKQVPAAGAQLVACDAIIAGAKLLAAVS